MTSIKDVARLAGVSTATVSRVLSNSDLVTEETRAKIFAVIEETGYVANSLARSFRTNKSYSILVLVPNIANPFFGEIIQGIESVAQRSQYRILLGDTQYQASRESVYGELLRNKQADGVISLGRSLPIFAMNSAEVLNIPIIMGCEFGEKNGPPTVCIDNQQAAFDATEHLIKLGHTQIALINAPQQSPLAGERWSGFQQAMKQYKCKINKDLICHGDFSMASGAELARKLLEAPANFSGLFAANDEMAIGAIKAIKDYGKQVPEDVSVIGFDDIPFAAFSSPSLTTIRQPRREMGERLMEIMLGHIHQIEKVERGRLVLPHTLVVRASTAQNNH